MSIVVLVVEDGVVVEAEACADVIAALVLVAVVLHGVAEFFVVEATFLALAALVAETFAQVVELLTLLGVGEVIKAVGMLGGVSAVVKLIADEGVELVRGRGAGSGFAPDEEDPGIKGVKDVVEEGARTDGGEGVGKTKVLKGFGVGLRG